LKYLQNKGARFPKILLKFINFGYFLKNIFFQKNLDILYFFKFYIFLYFFFYKYFGVLIARARFL